METREERIGRAVLEFWDVAIGENGNGEVSGADLVDVVGNAILAAVREEARSQGGGGEETQVAADADVEIVSDGYWVDARVWVPRCV